MFRQPRTQTYPQVIQQSQATLQPVGKFQNVPENYSKHHVSTTGNREADEIIREAREYFESNALHHRKDIDLHLKAFKDSIGKGPEAPLPACFDSWKKKAFNDWEEFPQNGWFQFEPIRPNDKETVVEAIWPNKHRNLMSEEVNIIGLHEKNILDSCHVS